MKTSQKFLLILLFPIFWFCAMYFPMGILLISMAEILGRVSKWGKVISREEYNKYNMPVWGDIVLYFGSLVLVVVGWLRFPEIAQHQLYPFAFVSILAIGMLDFIVRYKTVKEHKSVSATPEATL